jgi:hypothetical protein
VKAAYSLAVVTQAVLYAHRCVRQQNCISSSSGCPLGEEYLPYLQLFLRRAVCEQRMGRNIFRVRSCFCKEPFGKRDWEEYLPCSQLFMRKAVWEERLGGISSVFTAVSAKSRLVETGTEVWLYICVCVCVCVCRMGTTSPKALPHILNPNNSQEFDLP